MKAYPEAELWKLEGYGHVEGYTHPEYEKRLLDFLGSDGASERGADVSDPR